jgi:hypothetical protein
MLHLNASIRFYPVRLMGGLLVGVGVLIAAFVSTRGFAAEPAPAKPQVTQRVSAPSNPSVLTKAPAVLTKGPVVAPVTGDKGPVSPLAPEKAAPAVKKPSESSDQQTTIQKTPVGPAGKKAGFSGTTDSRQKQIVRSPAQDDSLRLAKRERTAAFKSKDSRGKTGNPKPPNAPVKGKQATGTNAPKKADTPPGHGRVVVSPF